MARSERSAATRSPQDRARRAFARRQRARRWLTWRKVLAAALVVAAVAFSVYGLYFSSWLRAEGVRVTGADILTTDEVLAAAEVDTGGALIRVDLDAIAHRVRSLAAVKDVDVSRQWPHDVRIEIVERVPVAVLDLGARQVALDADGYSFPTPASDREGLPRVTVGGGADRDALKEGASVVASLDPTVAGLVDHLEVQTVDEILLHLDDGRLVRWGSADQSDDKAAVLLQLLKRKAEMYDVSVPGAPTTR